MIATAKEAHQVINEYRRVVASIKQGQASLNRLKWSTTNWSALPDRLTRRWPPFHSPAGGSLSIPEQLSG